MQALKTTVNPFANCDRNELITALKRNDQHAFTHLYDYYSGALFAMIKKIIGSTANAEDVLQNCFVKIYVNVQKYEIGKGSLFSWMACIARNESLDFLRSRAARENARTSGIGIDLPIHHDFNAGAYDLRNCLTRLTASQRTIISLFLHGHTCEEISLLLCAPVGTVKSRMRVIYKKIRSNFN